MKLKRIEFYSYESMKLDRFLEVHKIYSITTFVKKMKSYPEHPSDLELERVDFWEVFYHDET